MKPYFFIVLFSFLFQLQRFGQSASAEDYIIINKTECTAQITAHCTDMTAAFKTLLPGEDWVNNCPTGSLLCTVTMVLPNTSHIIVSPDFSLPCLDPGMSILPSSSCYTQNVQWNISGPYVICNIY